ncbi:ECF transporter S component [Peptoniphilus sp. oral taxon 386]|uniref:ECF transporter S component n=1 Tax=Peptoniphilus sp. oral taxon 386 TaxID=652713 RepID=UPI0001DAA0DF|nr:ECF transporter S component [Peptoniphilus sp. oral taxon 386]EFI41670.1 hypothetical protein HMPREF0629_00293 [Peptoniphilus sp. oral taxon 386 str. F0131]
MNNGRKRSVTNRQLVVAAMLGAVTVVLGLTPLGFIPLGIINATTMHIPVIIAGILEGPIVGAAVGLIFGVSSLFNAITRPGPISFVFYNPLISIVPRILIGLVSAYVYRFLKDKNENSLKKASTVAWLVIIAFLAYLLQKNIKSDANTTTLVLMGIFLVISIFMLYYTYKHMNNDFSITAAAFLGSMTNTIFVLGGIYLIYAERYMNTIGKPIEQARTAILGVTVTSGIPEAILSVIITTAVVKAMLLGRGK